MAFAWGPMSRENPRHSEPRAWVPSLMMLPRSCNEKGRNVRQNRETCAERKVKETKMPRIKGVEADQSLTLKGGHGGRALSCAEEAVV